MDVVTSATMDDEDEFETHFRRAAERAPVKQLSQQYSPITMAPTTTTRRASLQAPDVIYSFQTASSSKRSSPSPSRGDVYYETRTSTTPTSPNRHSARRRSRQSPADDVERQAESSSSSSTTATWLAKHFDQPHGSGSRSRPHRRSPLKSLVSSPADVTTPRSQSPSAGPNTSRHGRRATLAGDLLQIPPTLGGYPDVDRRSSSVSPPSRSPAPSPSPSSDAREQRSSRRKMESGQAWSTSADDRRMRLAMVGYSRDSGSVAVGGKSHMVRTFELSAKGVVNVRNAVRDDDSFDDDEAAEVRTGRAERPTVLRHASAGRRTSTTADRHSPRLSPQRVLTAAAAVCNEIYADQSSRRWRSEPQSESPEYKVLVVGDHGVGKTELIRHFTLSYAATSTSPGQHHRYHHHHQQQQQHDICSQCFSTSPLGDGETPP